MRTTVTSRGQVTIPQSIRTKAKIVAGSQLDFQLERDGILVVRLITDDISELKGIVKTERKKAGIVARDEACYCLWY